MQPEERELLKTLVEGQANMREVVDKITRGIYGEEDNDSTGLIVAQKKDGERFKDLEKKIDSFIGQVKDNTKFRNKVISIGKGALKSTIGGSVITGGGIYIFFDKIKQLITTLFNQ